MGLTACDFSVLLNSVFDWSRLTYVLTYVIISLRG